MIGHLTSFAISLAAGIALEIYPAINQFRKQGVDKQIKLAFNTALKDWSVNKGVREQKEHELTLLLQSHIEKKNSIIPKTVDQEIYAFITLFEKRLAEYTQAYDYLKSIVDQKRHDKIVSSFSRMEEQLSEIQEEIKKRNIDARDVSDWLDKIAFDKGEKEVEYTINEKYKKREIGIELKEVLLLVTEKIYERTDELSQEIKDLKSQGNTYLANIFEQIKEAVEQRKPKSLSTIYEKYLQKEKEEKIELLQELIESSKAMFAYKEVKQFYKELLVLESSAKHHFNFGFFLQEFNFFEKAIQQYEEALIIYQDLTTENSRTYLSDVAMTLNNLALLHRNRNEFSLALSEFEESLAIYKNLTLENPHTYLPEVAMTLNNLAVLHMARDEFELALSEYEETLGIYKLLAKENPHTYLPEVAMTLNNLGLLYYRTDRFLLAFSEYEKSLEIRRELAKENPHKYSLDVAQILHNLGNLHSDKNEFSLAFSEYKEALKILKELTKKNPRAYLLDLAMTLNSLAILYKDMDEISLGLEKYEESLILYKKLAKEHPQAYEIEYGKMVLEGVVLFEKDKNDLKEAKTLLLKYPDIPKAQKFLQMIDDLEK